MSCALLATSLKNYFSFSCPIGWDELGVVATVGAVIVALWANRGARKQLKSALEMQEQSKNVSLLEQRVKIADLIRADEEPSTTAMHVLFNKDICRIYDILSEARKRYQDAQYDERVFFDAAKEPDGEGGCINEVESKIKEYEYYMSRPDCPDKIFREYQAYCDKNEMWWSDTGLSDDRRVYNHAEISKRISSSQSEISQAKKEVLEAIETYIANSIAPVNKNQKRRRKL